MKVLDCTFRDGGYYNKWDFDIKLVDKYLLTIKESGISVIELGFRGFPMDSFLGAFAYTSDDFIDSLDIDENITIAVMINASEILNSDMSIKEALSFLFKPSQNTRLGMVRIATHIKDVPQCKEIANHLHQLGYQIALNLMQVTLYENKELSRISKLINSWNLIDILYFADSLGNMESPDVKRISSAIKSEWNGDLGFHAHNNRGLAMANTIEALENGVSWVDCTMLGMGRGAGNVQTENLLLELSTKHGQLFKLKTLFYLIMEYFLPLMKKYEWGPNLFYNLAALNNIHPTYIQEMLVDKRYTNKEIFQAIEFMSSIDATKYNKDLLIRAKGDIDNKGSWNAKNWCLGREVLVLGSGPSLQKYKKAIIDYISKYKPVVIAINIVKDFPLELIDVYSTANESKMISDGSKYNELNKPIAISQVLFKKVSQGNLDKIMDYGVNIQSRTLKIYDKECTLPYEISAGYAMCLADVGGASSISLVGFDGYDIGDIRQIRMNKLLTLFAKSSSKSFVSLTPTTYNICEGSIYATKY